MENKNSICKHCGNGVNIDDLCGNDFHPDCLLHTEYSFQDQLNTDKSILGLAVYFYDSRNRKIRIDPTKMVVQRYTTIQNTKDQETLAVKFIRDLYDRMTASSYYDEVLHVMWDDTMFLKETMENILFRIGK